MSIATNFEDNFKIDIKRKNFCHVTFRRHVLAKCISHGPWGPDGDTMYWFEDGGMLLERRIVREFQLFKG